MPPRKKPSIAVPAVPLPPPNTLHPCHSTLASVLGDLPDRSHPPSYHLFYRTSGSPRKKAKTASKYGELPDPIKHAWEVERVQHKLLTWFEARREHRGMPWRKDNRPHELSKKDRSQRGYEVWVSEIMLQQTQVATVIPYFERWIARFPTVKDLAQATVDDVNAIWTGLGYYSRAKRLLEGAQTVTRDFDGFVPEELDDLLKIEGIGPYSAGAISSIAFGKRNALVDGNVTRVLSRLTALHAPATAKSTTSYIWAMADLLVPENIIEGDQAIKNRPGSWNQGLMELGATVCTPKNPKCGECPLNEDCLAYQEARYIKHRPAKRASERESDLEDLCTLCSPLPARAAEEPQHVVEIYPMAKERKKQREEETAVCLVEWQPSGGDLQDRQVLVFKRPEKGLLAGLLEFPSVDLPPNEDALSTKGLRSKHIVNLLKTLLALPSDFKLNATSEEAAASRAVKVQEQTTFEPVVHVYSHIIRTYHTVHIVLSSDDAPALLAPTRGTTEVKLDKKDQLVQSQAGTGKWIDASKVAGESLGGAMKKVWELRQEALGLGTDAVKKTKGGTKLKGGHKVDSQKTAEKGQKSLMGFFGAKDAKTAVKQEVAVRGDDDDDVMIVEEIRVGVSRSDGAAPVQLDLPDGKKVYKKRRIAPSSDEDEP
ncbi:A/G-specific adenine glycosylase [Sporobolomyces koalae]|uniref:A/G-specific adenine glycosylase n=1 Tax=Sporobolomyces koalae TaxID=500713 RepID=UPI0031724A50